MSEDATLAIDVGGSAVKLAWATPDGAVRHLPTVPVESLRAGQDVLTGIAALAAEHVRSAPPGLGAANIGLVIPGPVDQEAGVGLYSVMLGWRGAPVRRVVEDACGVPVVLGHDVGEGAVAEGALGAARGHTDWLFVALGTGLGSAMVLGGRPYRGAAGWGGELSHVVVDPRGPVCPCGKRGCLEVLASASGLARRYAAMVGSAPVTAAEVARRAAAGDVTAATVWAEGVAALGGVLASAIEMLNPSLVVVGGGVADSGEQLLAPLREHVAAGVRFVQPVPRVVPAQLGARAGVHGAALLGLGALAEPAIGRTRPAVPHAAPPMRGLA